MTNDRYSVIRNDVTHQRVSYVRTEAGEVSRNGYTWVLANDAAAEIKSERYGAANGWTSTYDNSFHWTEVEALPEADVKANWSLTIAGKIHTRSWYDNKGKADKAAKRYNDQLDLETAYLAKVTKLAHFVDQTDGVWSKINDEDVEDRMTAGIGDIVCVYSQQRWRLGVVVGGKLGSKNIKVMVTSPTAVEQARQLGNKYPNPVYKTVSREMGS